MKRQLPLALALVLLALACVPAWASDGEIVLVATEVGNRANPKECDYWIFKHRGKTQGSGFGPCIPPPFIDVYAQLGGASADGITGAEYAASIGADSNPDAGYFFLEMLNPDHNVAQGRAFVPPDPQPRGLNIGFPDCQTGTNGRVWLERIQVISFQACGPGVTPPGLDFEIGQHSSPSNGLFRCPLLVLCDGPTFTKVCTGTNLTPCANPLPPHPINSTCSTSGTFSINPAVDGTCQHTKAGLAENSINDDAQSATWSSVKNLYQ